ncbi:hypothetical protein OEA41_004647 [Lepraria neglecta]|uniref:HTH psq-type domain-containing protein n=1 Tax=Lepraria neglecta TaxID=209136 RepID=A0AAD9YZJ4_9LECA|nr:hypothetical protein OEA41_004647 [Lepraria neglecta]
MKGGPSVQLDTDPWDVEIPDSERLEQAHKAWMAADKKISVRKITQKHGVLPQTLNKRVNGGASAEVKYQRFQRLTPEEEIAIERWILRLQA